MKQVQIGKDSKLRKIQIEIVEVQNKRMAPDCETPKIRELHTKEREIRTEARDIIKEISAVKGDSELDEVQRAIDEW